MPAPELVEVAASLGVAAVACGETVADALDWADFLSRAADLPGPTPDPDAPALVVYTSGTTGKPKGAVISHRAYAEGAYLQASRYFHEDAAVVAYLPVNHVAGLLDLGAVPLAMGGCLHHLATFDPGAVLDLIEVERITMWGGVPTVMQITAAHPRWATTDFSSLRHLVWGGSPMPLDLVPVLRATGARLGVVYGLTEDCVASTYSEADETDEQLAATIGRPDPRLEFRLDGPQGGPGELLLRNPCLMTEYLANPAATAEAFTRDGFLRTGDIATLRADGRLELVGRTKEMFKSGGYNVYPREVEIALESHPWVDLVAVVETADPTFHQVGVAFVVPSADAGDDLEERLRAHARDRLASYKVPKRFVVTSEVPRTTIGKIDRRRLRSIAADSER